MGDFIPHSQVVQHNIRGGEMEICRHNIMMEGNNFPRLRHELGINIESLRACWDKFWVVERANTEHRQQLIFEEGRGEVGTLNVGCLLDEALHILNSKRTVEFKLDEISKSALSFVQKLKEYLIMYEKLHVFSKRDDNFTNILDDIGEQAEKVVQFLEEISATISGQLANIFYFLTVYQAISGSCAYLSTYPTALLDAKSYESNFDAHLKTFQNMKRSVYRRFTLIVSSQPPPVIQTERPRPVSLTFFNLHNSFRGKFTIKVYMVSEETVKEIRSTGEIPKSISAITRPPILTSRGSRLHEGSVVPGTIFLQEILINRANKRKQKTQRATLTKGTIKATSGHLMELLDGEWMQDGRKSQCIERSLVVKEIEKKTNNDAANIKVALLFVAELPQGQQQVWTISAPMIVITHGSQNEKAWGTMAWDEVASKQGRLDFEVEPFANWSQVREMLKGTFECLVGRQLTESHVEYLRGKVAQMVSGIQNQQSFRNIISDETKVSRTALFGGPHLPFWACFYRNVSVIRINGNFNEIWVKGFIHGFIEDRDARLLLAKGLADNTAQPGYFVVRFSESSPGSLTFVFIGIDNMIYKMEPLEVRKKKAVEECTLILLRHLNVRERHHCQELFTHIYPNIPKQVAFKKFYTWAKKHPSPAFEEKGYVKMCNFVPLPTTPTIPLPARTTAATK